MMKFSTLSSILLLIATISNAGAFAPAAPTPARVSLDMAVAVSADAPKVGKVRTALRKTKNFVKSIFRKNAKSPMASNPPPSALSVPYEAAALLAYEAEGDSSMTFNDFKVKYEADAVALVTSKKPVNLSVPYDSAAILAYEASGKEVGFPEFNEQYQADAVALVKSKNVDLSVPYDAAAVLAYKASDRKIAFAEFKEKYEADAVALAKSKKN